MFCTICLRPDTTITLACGHAYHRECLVDWRLHNLNTCLMCRMEKRPEPPYIQHPAYHTLLMRLMGKKRKGELTKEDLNTLLQQL